MKLQSFLAGLIAFACLQNAHAVYVAQDGIGQALIYSYYTANGEHDTLFSIVNPHGSPPKAVKVRFLEGKNSKEVLDFNLYLSKYDVWVAAIIPTAAGAGSPGTSEARQASSPCVNVVSMPLPE